MDSKYAIAIYINLGPSIFLMMNNVKTKADDDINEKEEPNTFLF